MKLVVCGDCGDLVRLRPSLWSRCGCRRAGGVYQGDREALYSGPDGTAVVGMHAGSFTTAVGHDQQDRRNGVHRDLGHEIKAFTIPWSVPTVKRIPLKCVFEERKQFALYEKLQNDGGTIRQFKSYNGSSRWMYVIVDEDHENDENEPSQ
jgi:hypothetical protein